MTGRLRSMRFTALAAAMLLVPVGARAALSPYWQSAKEFAAIVNDQRVHEALKYEEAIQSIRLTAPDVYELTTERCTLTIEIVDKPAKPGLMGPRQFDSRSARRTAADRLPYPRGISGLRAATRAACPRMLGTFDETASRRTERKDDETPGLCPADRPCRAAGVRPGRRLGGAAAVAPPRPRQGFPGDRHGS